MQKERKVFVDLLKCLAILFVVFYHITPDSVDFISGTEKYAEYIKYFFRTILSTCVPIFFFVNGYLLFGKPLDIRKHIFKTVRFLLLAVVWGVGTLFILQFIKGEYFSPAEFLIALLKWKQGWINHLWYIGALICIYIAFPLLKSVYDVDKRIFFYFTGVCVFFTIGNKTLNNAATVLSFFAGKDIVVSEENFFNIFNPFRGIRGYSFAYFCLGGTAYYLKEKIESIPYKKRNLIAVIGLLLSCAGLFFVGICYSVQSGEMYDVVWNGYDTIFTFFNTVFIYVLCLNLKKNYSMVRHISSNTLGIYFMHFIFLCAFKPYISGILPATSFVGNLIYAVLITLLCSGICDGIKKVPLLSEIIK